ncbi:MAG: UbiX family flavin prenyltransferase [Candidatus Omnitrophota bacterium]
MTKAPYVVALSGASGAGYGLRLIRALAESGYAVDVIISDTARWILKAETGLRLERDFDPHDFAPVLGKKLAARIRTYRIFDFTAPPASGSYRIRGMAVIPCSMGTLGALASGVSGNLIHRAADCALKEGRRLVVVPRETPLHAIHLQNLLKLTEAGAKIVPAMPAFYGRPQTIEELVDFVVAKVLNQLGVEHDLGTRWAGPSGKED